MADRPLSRLIELLEAAIRPEVVGNHEFYRYIPLPSEVFLAELGRIAEVTSGRRFLEVGSGLGSKLVLGRLLGFDVRGVEIQPRYIEFSRQLIDCPVWEGDAFAFPDYRRFDVVYTYRPFVNLEREQLLEMKIARDLKMGTVLWLPFSGKYGHIERLGMHRLWPGVWVKR